MSAEDEHMARFLKRFGELGFRRGDLRPHRHAFSSSARVLPMQSCVRRHWLLSLGVPCRGPVRSEPAGPNRSEQDRIPCRLVIGARAVARTAQTLISSTGGAVMACPTLHCAQCMTDVEAHAH